MSRCPVYDAIRRHRPDLLKRAGKIVAHNSVEEVIDFMHEHGWLTEHAAILHELHRAVVNKYESIDKMPAKEREDLRVYIKPIVEKASHEVVTLIEREARRAEAFSDDDTDDDVDYEN